MVISIKTFNGTGADTSGSSGDSNRVLTLPNSSITSQNGFLVTASGLTLAITTEYTVVHGTSATAITFLNPLWDDSTVVVNYEFFQGEFFFGLTFKDQRGSIDEIVSIGTGFISLEENITYVLDKNSLDDGDYIGGGGAYRPSTLDEGEYYTTSLVTGELTITRVDLSNSIISGIFWFDAINSENEIVEIREGRFDFEY